MACNAYATIACTQPQQPIQTDIGATHVTQDGYNIITYTKQQKPIGFDEYCSHQMRMHIIRSLMPRLYVRTVGNQPAYVETLS
jgi:hypothetical protein